MDDIMTTSSIISSLFPSFLVVLGLAVKKLYGRNVHAHRVISRFSAFIPALGRMPPVEDAQAYTW